MRESQTILGFMREGEEKGRLKHAREVILLFLQNRFETIPQDIESALTGTNDLDTLNRWILSSADVASLDDFRAAMK